MDAPIVPGQEKDFSTWVRNWIHYDTLASSLYKQTVNARKVRDQFEGRILAHVKERNIPNVVLQTQQGKFQPVQETHSSPLSMTQIESLLHKYFHSRGASIKDETAAILAFIKANRQHTKVTRLRRVGGNQQPLSVPELPQLQ
jgi:hypothetical protein